ncbi:hypothetical protein NBRC116594_00220 [Shimia sp. NS0008-38b]|uniref:hypothetical protein n=1 Tax=Shimia sp. NS0008-38b TaxID=3127653 RepID=UPI00310AC4F1
MTIQKTGAAAALPFLINPATVGLVAIGAVGWGLFKLLGDDEETNGDEGLTLDEQQRSKKHLEADEAVAVYEEACVEESGEPPIDLSSDDSGARPTDDSANEARQAEIVRQAMSELGKRSAAARARRKAALSEMAKAER